MNTNLAIQNNLEAAQKLARAGSFEEAAHLCHQIRATAPDEAEVWAGLGDILAKCGQYDETLAMYQQAARLAPGRLKFRFKAALFLPHLYSDPAQISDYLGRYSRELDRLNQELTPEVLAEEAVRKEAYGAMAALSSFYPAYSGLDVTGLQRTLGGLIERITKANFPLAELLPARADLPQRPPGSKIRLGYVSALFHAHTVSKLFSGWLKHHDRADFEIYCYYLNNIPAKATPSGKKLPDPYVQLFQHYSDHFYALADPEEACSQIQADNLDLLVFTDIGMSGGLLKVASRRLAPVQAMAWGHPVTSGLPTIDYFISSELMEPPDADRHYTEKLVRLPGPGLCYNRPTLPRPPRDRASYGWGAEAVVYLSCQALFKYLPQHDYIFPAIARQVPQARFVFIENPDVPAFRFQERLQRAFEAHGLQSADFCRILPAQDWLGYIGLNLLADVFLDTPGWSGGNTTLEALACDLPVVTCPGPFMRGRHSAAFLNVLGLPETIAPDEPAYIELAVRLGLDPQWRAALRQKIQANSSKLFNDQTSVIALEAFYRQAVNSNSPSAKPI